MRKFKRTIEYFETNGVKQYLLHHPSQDNGAPVLLIVHGGPGNPDSNLAPRFARQWGDHYHLVSWDQRGCGKTLAANGSPPSYQVTTELILSDMEHIIEHLKQTYKAEKVYLLGVSWGTVLCSLYSLKHPEHVKAYIAAGQFCNFYRNEIVGYAKVKELAQAAGNQKDIDLLDSLAPYPEKPFSIATGSMGKKFGVVKRVQSKYGLTITADLHMIWMIFVSPVFKFSDFSNYSKKTQGYNKDLITYLSDFEILDYGFDYKVPVCYILGERDYQASMPLAAEYFEQINAPGKLLRVIKDAGHNMIFDQPEAFAKALAEARTLVEGLGK